MTHYLKQAQMIVALLVLLGAGIWWGMQKTPAALPEAYTAEEIEKIKATRNLDEQVKLYRQLIEQVGAGEAQEQLFRSGLPFTGQTHLLNHTVGDWLYEKYGAAGLKHCKVYFLASCDHGFVLRAIGAGGIDEVVKVMEECRKAGPPVFTQCSHAVGHGFLVSSGYKNFLESLTLCDEAATKVSQFPLFNCHDGAFMENIWGVHEGAPSPDRWVKAEDYIYPCDEPRIDERYMLACWSNQPALIYQRLHGDLKKVSEVCEELTNSTHRQMCFDGLSRQIHPLAAGSADQTFELCSLLPAEWINFCIGINASAGFAVGDRVVAFELCGRIPEAGKEKCYGPLFGSIRGYATSETEYRSWCERVKDEVWKRKCI